MLEVITFDLWDTVIHDDSDEPVRASQGLRTKHDERRHLVWHSLNAEQALDFATLCEAYDAVDREFNHVWRNEHVTWPVRQRLNVLLARLGRNLPDSHFAKLVREIEEMELAVMPAPIDGVCQVISELAQDYRLGVVSDAIYSPGRCLREWLDAHGVKRYFDAFAFSDEVGHSKPHPTMFETISRELDVPFSRMLHIGDRDHNDVRGSQALGMQAILFTATRDADRARTNADAVCDDAADLPSIIRTLATTAS